ncbi:MAG: AI-2E family transporter [Alphaproteobacteria bacterium]|nr:AI-2E family transporter [Alphaproteobacteria bacterium]
MALASRNRNMFFWLVLLGLFATSVYVLRSVLMPFVAGIIIGYLLDPWATRFEKLGMNRTWATVLTMFLLVLILVPSLIALFGIIDSQLGHFLNVLPKYLTSFAQKLEPVIVSLQERFPALEADRIREAIRGNMGNTLKMVGNILRKLLSGGFALVNIVSLLLITPVVAFYMLRDWDSFVKKVDDLLPKHSKKSIEKQAKEIDSILSSFIRGQLSVCVLLGLFYAVGLYFVGLDLGILVGFIAGIISFIPYVGSIFGFVVSIAIAFAQFDTLMPVAQVVGVFMVGQFIEGNFLTPNLVGDSVGLHPVWIMFALLAGGVLLGFLGLMIAVPVAAIIGVLVRHAIENYKESSLYR